MMEREMQEEMQEEMRGSAMHAAAGAVPDDTLEQPAERGARLIALHLLDAAAAARARLGAPEDEEALHDFRVAVRRLRSWLRALRPYLRRGVRKRERRRLARIARATGESRDLEVHLAWLRGERGSLTARERHGVDWLVQRLEARRPAADAELFATVARDFERTERALRRSLERYRVTERLRPRAPHEYATVPRRDAPTLAAACAELLREHAGELRARLDAVAEEEDEAAAHRARIAGKRLRYLLEPLSDAAPEAVELVEALKRLQDLLGDLHDAHVFTGELTTALEEAVAERARAEAAAALAGSPPPRAPGRDPRAGLVALARRLRERSGRAFEAAEREWLGGRAEPFLERVTALAAALEARGRRGVEIERKYLLSAFPPEAERGEVQEMAQGYIPGTRLAERVRRVRENGEERWFRTIKLGLGMARLEVEEETTRAIFDGLWPLTEGHRVRKTRFVIPDGALAWEIDRFDDRDLVLAEVELPATDTAVDPPEWLRPYIVREVTGEAAYQNINLAR
ncbi:MAG TPA: CHAD domain-containing protein [Gemmatimonadaceae bacterium]|nr:CHAD domain-containing protein [Gemmatimonadaceae bacterium]